MEVIQDELQKNGVRIDIETLTTAYLTLIRCMNLPEEEDVRKAVRLVVPSLKNIIRVDGITSLKNAPIPDQIFIYVLCSSIGYTPMDTT